MMGMERNSDVVKMASYAPIFANVNDLKWRPDMIQFDGTSAFGTPSYYVQKVMADNIGTRVLPTTLHNPYTDIAAQQAVKPEICKVGVGTWGTQASFTQQQIHGDNITTTADPATKDQQRGEWKESNGVSSQTSDTEGAMKMEPTLIKGNEYTYNVRARKDKGAEGFLVVFNYVDPDNYCWLNIGGWGNTQNAIEQIINGSKAQVATAAGHVEDGKWYDVSVHVKGDSVYASLDGKQLFAVQLKPTTFAGLFSNATMDEKTGEVIVKVVNTTGANTTAKINLNGKTATAATVIRLASAKGTDENSLEDPTKVYPTQQTLSPSGNSVEVALPGSSLNIIRIK